MNRYRESDSPILSEKPSNKTGDNKPVAEKVEKSWLRGIRPSETGTWIFLPNDLDRIRYAAERNRKEQFISLWHHVYDINRLIGSFLTLYRWEDIERVLSPHKTICRRWCLCISLRLIPKYLFS